MEQVFIKQVFLKEGVSKLGKAYKFWNVVLGDGRTASSDDDVSHLIGQSVNADVITKTNGQYQNHSIKIPQQAAAVVAAAPVMTRPPFMPVAAPAATSADIGMNELKLKVLYAAVEAASFVYNKMEGQTEKTAGILTIYDTFLAKINEK